MLNKEHVLKQLFYREVYGTPIKEREDALVGSEEQEAYAEWRKSKRDFLKEEVGLSCWIKSCTAGYITEVTFHDNGEVTEFTLFERLKTVGTWTVTAGILSVSIVKGDNHYDFLIVANSTLQIHSAIEYKNNELHSYLKLAPIKP